MEDFAKGQTVKYYTVTKNNPAGYQQRYIFTWYRPDEPCNVAAAACYLAINDFVTGNHTQRHYTAAIDFD